MLAIRLQRQGRKGYPVYRIIVQEAQLTPTSGRVVAFVGSYNPHTKETKLNTEIIEKYLSTGAQPTPRVVKLLIENKVKLPKWVEKLDKSKQKKTRFADKLRKNQPAEAEPEAESSTSTEGGGAVKEVAPAEPETPAKEIAPVENETPAETETTPEAEAPAEAEAPKEGEAPVEAETPAEEPEKAE